MSGKNISPYEFVRMIDGMLKYESPNDNFDEFEGKLKLTNFPSSKPISIDNFVCWGFFLVNTEKVYGLAVNVGNDNKCLFKQMKWYDHFIRSKSRFSYVVNTQIAFILLSVILSAVFTW